MNDEQFNNTVEQGSIQQAKLVLNSFCSIVQRLAKDTGTRFEEAPNCTVIMAATMFAPDFMHIKSLDAARESKALLGAACAFFEQVKLFEKLSVVKCCKLILPAQAVTLRTSIAPFAPPVRLWKDDGVYRFDTGILKA